MKIMPSPPFLTIRERIVGRLVGVYNKDDIDRRSAKELLK
jgi:hypothetical protein